MRVFYVNIIVKNSTDRNVRRETSPRHYRSFSGGGIEVLMNLFELIYYIPTRHLK